uniref:Reverse transcriptase domain-containing protein n=1 Tax=Lepisosteus oculatus TaxID=7918 RepID=W5N930_LEPOC
MMDFVYKTENVLSLVCTLITAEFAKAFDTVDHTTAVQCLLVLGVRTSLNPWACSFMTDRRQKVQYQRISYLWSCTGNYSILGPIVFLALINSALQERIHHWKYVDVMNVAQMWTLQLPCTLQQTLKDLVVWVEEHKMKLNSKKCKVLHVTHMRYPPVLPALFMDQNILEVHSTVQVLEVIIQDNLRWDNQVDHMLMSANRKLFFSRCLKKFGVCDSELVSFYKHYVRLVLEYAVTVWHSSLSNDQTKKLECIKKQVCKITLGQRYSGYPDTLCILGLCTLSERRTWLCLDLNLTLGIGYPLPGRRLLVTIQKTQIPRCWTERYRRSPIPYMCKLLNNNGF